MSRQIIPISEAHLVGRRGKEISTHVGTYLHAITTQMVERYPNRLITVKELAQIQFGKVNEDSIWTVRRKLWQTVNVLLEDGKLTFIKYANFYGGYGRVMGIKSFNRETDQRDFDFWLSRYIKRYQQTADKLSRIELLMKAA